MPTWDSIIGYREHRSDVLDRLRGGYPRFVLHPDTRKLVELCTKETAGPKQIAMPFPMESTACRGLEFLAATGTDPKSCDVKTWRDFAVLVAPEQDSESLFKFWRYSGEIVSSRLAEDTLGDRVEPEDRETSRQLKNRLGEWIGVPENDVGLYATGMAAIYAIHRAALRCRRAPGSVQIDFPYVDSWRVQKEFGEQPVQLDSRSPNCIEQLNMHCGTGRIGAIFCEVPSNPLMQTADLARIREVADSHRVPVIVDDTLATCYNVDVLAFADVILTSLTKNISGRGDVMGGALFLNPDSYWYQPLRVALAEDPGLVPYQGDVRALEKNSRDFTERMPVINERALEVARFLEAHPKVETVWYPGLECSPEFKTVHRAGRGHGSTLSFLLKDLSATPRIFDGLRCSKGPSLGTDFSLACPYTLLAHYEEAEWAASRGVPLHLIRVSAGLEAPGELVARIEEAISDC